MGIDTILTAIVGTTALTLSVMFLPAAIELMQPKDAGPRLISGCIEVTNLRHVINIEEENQLHSTAFQRFGFLDNLPSLELEVI